ncbi:MAG: agmatine deiminase family protein [Planctomycetes bacterium]|nr:agmatine deiminase family protein [Planctomycetota bacterium]
MESGSWGDGAAEPAAARPRLPFDQALLELWQGAGMPEPQPPQTAPPRAVAPYRLPAEFERQGATFLGCGELATFYPEVLADVVEAVRHRMDVAALVPDADCKDAVVQILAQRGLTEDAVRFVEAPHDTMWVRDYGPLFVHRTDNGEPVVVDADYERFARPNDDSAPQAVASQLRLAAVKAPLAMEGGNLLTNGRGLCVTTTTLVERNAERGYGEDDVSDLLHHFFGAVETVFLEPLSGEPTGHVDMFAVFTDPGTVVVGEYSFLVDPENAAILDRNAARLAQTQGPDGFLKVVRIPMPPHEGESWRTFTNVIFANGLLLTPVYDDLNNLGEREAVEAYRRLLPGWRVAGIDVSRLIGNGGALHCISMNAPRMARWPTFRAPPRPLKAKPLGPIASRGRPWRNFSAN